MAQAVPLATSINKGVSAGAILTYIFVARGNSQPSIRRDGHLGVLVFIRIDTDFSPYTI